MDSQQREQYANKMKRMVNFKEQYFLDFNKVIVLKIPKKVYFYFQVINDMKVVSKEALIDIYGYDCEDLFEYFRSNNKLMPYLIEETKHFFVFEYLTGEILKDITKADFDYLRQFENAEFFPFHNSLYTNIIRLSNGNIKLIDFKHLDNKITKLPKHLTENMFVFMSYKDESGLYIDDTTNIEEIKKILSIDYYNIATIRYKDLH